MHELKTNLFLSISVNFPKKRKLFHISCGHPYLAIGIAECAEQISVSAKYFQIWSFVDKVLKRIIYFLSQ